jgi:branched-chain amino acid transport system ATP-binding protein
MTHTLVVDRVSKSFGGLMAVRNVSLSVEGGTVLGLIGPNGAGKTTLFNLITGFHVPDKGRILAFGEEIQGRPPNGISDTGISRTFQLVEVFSTLSVEENIAVALSARGGDSLHLWQPLKSLANPEVKKILSMTGLEHRGDALVSEMGLPERKKVELAVALAGRPRLLLLDEPVAGMAADEKPALIDLIKTIQKQLGVTTIIVEHDMDVIWGIADRVAVLHYGEIISEGPPSEIRQDPKVREVYLGRARDA